MAGEPIAAAVPVLVAPPARFASGIGWLALQEELELEGLSLSVKFGRQRLDRHALRLASGMRHLDDAARILAFHGAVALRETVQEEICDAGRNRLNHPTLTAKADLRVFVPDRYVKANANLSSPKRERARFAPGGHEGGERQRHAEGTELHR